METTSLSEFTSAIKDWLTFIDPADDLREIDRARILKETGWMDAEERNNQTDHLVRALDIAKTQPKNRRLFVAMFLTTWWYTRLDENFGERIHCFVDGYGQDVPSLQDALQTWKERDQWFGRNNLVWDATDCERWIKEQTGLKGYELIRALKYAFQADRAWVSPASQTS